MNYLDLISSHTQKQKGEKSAFSSDIGSSIELHGVGSMFGRQSVERDVINAHLSPISGITQVLPLLPSVTEQPRFALVTGISDDIGSEPTNPCDPAPTGYMLSGMISAAFGRITRDTNVIDVTKVMLRRNRGDFTDLVLRGRMLGLTGLTPTAMNQSDVLNIVTQSEMVNAGVRLERKMAQVAWQGSTSNNTSGGGYKEGPGLDAQIATGIVDADTNTLMAAADSYVGSFGFNDISGVTLDIVEHLSHMMYDLEQRSLHMGLDPVQWVLCMRTSLFHELTAEWVCRYLTNRCNDASGTQVVTVNDSTNVTMRDAMRNSRYIIVNGKQYPVILDDGIFEHNNVNNGSVGAGSYASSIYAVPLTIAGNFPVTYREHIDYRAATADTSLLRGNETFWTDDGVYLWVYDQNRGCYKLGATTEQRIILRAPQLAGRLDSVLYTPVAHTRDWDTASPYYVAGGVSTIADETFNSVW